MNDEEKQAIEFMNNIEYKQVNSDEFYDNRDIILNLIKKQQKEIERLKGEYLRKVWELQGFIEKAEVADQECISKDKIREIISKYVDIEEHLVYHHEELWGVDLAEMIKELLGE